jgi:hypothetical protein
MGPFEMVVLIVFMSLVTGTIHKFIDSRAGIAKAQARGIDQRVQQAIEELRAEIAQLKQHETDAVLSFDSTLQNMDTRLKHLERRALAEGAAEPARVRVGADSEGRHAA